MYIPSFMRLQSQTIFNLSTDQSFLYIYTHPRKKQSEIDCSSTVDNVAKISITLLAAIFGKMCHMWSVIMDGGFTKK